MSGAPDLETLARPEHASRLLAWLAAKLGDVQAAEDALAEAFARAVPVWRREPPASPEGWLLKVAWRIAIDGTRRERTRAGTRDALAVIAPTSVEPDEPDDVFVDKRLELLFVCAHPAIAPAVRVPLMLQVVAGVDASRIASLYLASPAAMAQRLVRAKRRIAEAGIPFERPPTDEIDGRASAVLDAIYAVFTLGRAGSAPDDALAGALREEALWLAELATTLLPGSAEAKGLRALLLHVSARTVACAAGGYTPLHEQDISRWNVARIEAAEALLHEAARLGAPGRFQLEAAIQSAHCGRLFADRVDHAAIERLYDALLAVAPSFGAAVARASAIAAGGDPGRARDALLALDDERAAAYQPYWAARAFAAAGSGHVEEAADAYRRAAGLSNDPAITRFLIERRAALLS